MDFIFAAIMYAVIRLFCEKDPSLMIVLIVIGVIICLLGAIA